MYPRRVTLGLLLSIAAGLGVAALSLVPGWLEHTRQVLGEGSRWVLTVQGAWEREGLPVLGAGAVAMVLVAGAAALAVARPRSIRVGWLVPLVAVAVGLLVAGLPPVAQHGHSTGVTLSARWPLALAAGLGVAALAGVLLAARPSQIALVGVVTVVVAVTIGGWGGRFVQLHLIEGTGQFWSQGSYTRAATDGQPTETVSLRAGNVTVGDRWSGDYEPSGRVLSIVDDPACPDVRASYFVNAAPGGGITWVMIIDTCENGARAADLTTGVWVRDR